MANNCINPVCLEVMILLNGDQTAKSSPQCPDRPSAKTATQDIQGQSKIPDTIPIYCEQVVPICVGRQISESQGDQREREKDPAVLHVFALTCTNIGTSEQGRNSQQDGDQHEPDPSRMGKKAGEITPTHYYEAKEEEQKKEHDNGGSW